MHFEETKTWHNKIKFLFRKNFVSNKIIDLSLIIETTPLVLQNHVEFSGYF